MSDYGVFLRGMNLGRRRITNDDLVKSFASIGLPGATAFLASGNIAVATKRDEMSLQETVETGLRKTLGYEVEAFVRSARDLRAVAVATPFASRPAPAARGKLQVAWLKQKPSRQIQQAALALDCEADYLAFGARELYWWPSGGLSESHLDLKTLERLLGRMTIRTHATVSKMVNKLFAP